MLCSLIQCFSNFMCKEAPGYHVKVQILNIYLARSERKEPRTLRQEKTKIKQTNKQTKTLKKQNKTKQKPTQLGPGN